MQILKITNVAELRLRKGSLGTSAELQGYYLAGDEGGGKFYWDNTSVLVDNGGTIFTVSGITTGRWIRKIDKSHINPAWFGAKTDTTDAIIPINKSIEYAFNERIGEVKLNGKFRVSSSILIWPGINLKGTSSGFNNNPGTEISVTPGFNGHIIKSKFDETNSSDFWQHWGGISELSIVGDNQVTGCGIRIFRPGENFLINKVQVFRTASHAVMLYDAGTPCHIGYLSCHWCGHRDNGAGLYIQDMIQTTVHIQYLAGDNNKLGLLKVKNMFQSNVFLNAFKSERSDITFENPLNLVGHDDIIVVENGNNGVLTIGSGKVWLQAGISSPGSIINNFSNITSSRGQIQVLGSIATSIGATHGTYVNDYSGEIIVPFNTFLNTMGVHEFGRTNSLKGAYSTSNIYKQGNHIIKGDTFVTSSIDVPGGFAQFTLQGDTGGQLFNETGPMFITQAANQEQRFLVNGAYRFIIFPDGTLSAGDTLATIPSAVLNLSSIDKGFLVPRVTTVQRNAIVSPATGLIVYNTNTNNLNTYNGIIWLDVFSGKKGSSVQSGNGVLLAFTIPHGLGAIPTFINVQAGSANAQGISYITADATNITVNYDLAPLTGTNNLTFYWEATV